MTTPDVVLEALSILSSYINEQTIAADPTDVQGKALLRTAMDGVLTTRRAMKQLNEEKEFRINGPVVFSSKTPDDKLWVGRLGDGCRVIMRKEMLAPGEKYVIRTNDKVKEVWIESYGGALTYPNYVIVSQPKGC